MEEGGEEQRADQNQIRQASMGDRGEPGEEGEGLPREKQEGTTAASILHPLRQLGKSQENQQARNKKLLLPPSTSILHPLHLSYKENLQKQNASEKLDTG